MHAPAHPVNAWPLEGTAVRITEAPSLKGALQLPIPLVIAQVIPLGLEVTVPLPVPLPLTDSTNDAVPSVALATFDGCEHPALLLHSLIR
jgi:hypothetical protein